MEKTEIIDVLIEALSELRIRLEPTDVETRPRILETYAHSSSRSSSLHRRS